VGYAGQLAPVIRTAVEEARVLAECGVDGLMIENMHDRPYLKRTVGPEITAAMAAVGTAVREAAPLPLGVQILGGANREALAVAIAAGASFVRCEGFVFGHLADEGAMESDAGDLVRYRRAMQAESVRLFADVKKKHASHAVTADTDIAEHARAAAFFRADGVIVTGRFTGEEALLDDVRTVYEAVPVPTLVGSGLTADNLERYWPFVDGLIVGSALKEDGAWYRPLDPARIRRFLAGVERLRG
jgi:membrane complex biogenesis BtpA family protein